MESLQEQIAPSENVGSQMYISSVFQENQQMKQHSSKESYPEAMLSVIMPIENNEPFIPMSNIPNTRTPAPRTISCASDPLRSVELLQPAVTVPRMDIVEESTSPDNARKKQRKARAVAFAAASEKLQNAMNLKTGVPIMLIMISTAIACVTIPVIITSIMSTKFSNSKQETLACSHAESTTIGFAASTNQLFVNVEEFVYTGQAGVNSGVFPLNNESELSTTATALAMVYGRTGVVGFGLASTNYAMSIVMVTTDGHYDFFKSAYGGSWACRMRIADNKNISLAAMQEAGISPYGTVSCFPKAFLYAGSLNKILQIESISNITGAKWTGVYNNNLTFSTGSLMYFLARADQDGHAVVTYSAWLSTYIVSLFTEVISGKEVVSGQIIDAETMTVIAVKSSNSSLIFVNRLTNNAKIKNWYYNVLKSLEQTSSLSSTTYGVIASDAWMSSGGNEATGIVLIRRPGLSWLIVTNVRSGFQLVDWRIACVTVAIVIVAAVAAAVFFGSVSKQIRDVSTALGSISNRQNNAGIFGSKDVMSVVAANARSGTSDINRRVIATASNDEEQCRSDHPLFNIPLCADKLSRCKEIAGLQASLVRSIQYVDIYMKLTPSSALANLFAPGHDPISELYTIKEKDISIVVVDLSCDDTMLEFAGEPRVLTTILGEWHDLVAREITQFGGNIVNMNGACIMAIFGDINPETAEKRSELVANVLAAINALMPAFYERIRGTVLWSTCNKSNTPIGMHASYNSGKCAVGYFGYKNRLNYNAAGKVTKVAIELQRLCKLYKIDVLVTPEAAQGIRNTKYISFPVDVVTISDIPIITNEPLLEEEEVPDKDTSKLQPVLKNYSVSIVMMAVILEKEPTEMTNIAANVFWQIHEYIYYGRMDEAFVTVKEAISNPLLRKYMSALFIISKKLENSYYKQGMYYESRGYLGLK